MVKRLTALSCATAGLALASMLTYAQGRGAAEWTTTHSDAQRTGAVASDPRISAETMQKPGAFGPFKFLWKLKLEYEPNALTALTQPMLLDRLIGFRGFKSIAFVGTASGTVQAIDVDFGTRLWKYDLNYTASPPLVTTSTPACPGGLFSAISRPTSITPPEVVAGGGGGGRGRSGGGVGEPGRGAITLSSAAQQRGGGVSPVGAPPASAGAPAVPGSAAAAAGVVPGDLPAGARAGGGGGGGGAGRGGFTLGGDAAYVVGVDGYLHALNVQNGWDSITPVLFVPANTRATGLIVAALPGGGAMAYLATTHGCGSQSDSVWGMKLNDPQRAVIAYQPKESSIAGIGFSFGREGTIYASTTTPSSSEIVSLDPRTLTVKVSARLPQVQITTSPTLFETKGGLELAAVAGGGRIWLLESGALAKGAVASAALPGAGTFEAVALTSYVDPQGTRWVAAPTSNGIVAMKISEEGGTVTLVPGWTSRAIPSPLPAIVVNGVVFASSAGTKTVPAVLYALEAATGRELWTSGRTITSTVTGGLSAGQGNVYVPTADGTLYAFGFAIDK